MADDEYPVEPDPDYLHELRKDAEADARARLVEQFRHGIPPTDEPVDW